MSYHNHLSSGINTCSERKQINTLHIIGASVCHSHTFMSIITHRSLTREMFNAGCHSVAGKALNCLGHHLRYHIGITTKGSLADRLIILIGKYISVNECLSGMRSWN